jgi:hypothetical protein
MRRKEEDGGVRKTEPLKERSIYVYLPSERMVEEWKKRAKKQGVSISKFVVKHVENSLQQEEDSAYKPRGELLKEISELRNELRELKEDNRRKKISMLMALRLDPMSCCY